MVRQWRLLTRQLFENLGNFGKIWENLGNIWEIWENLGNLGNVGEIWEFWGNIGKYPPKFHWNIGILVNSNILIFQWTYWNIIKLQNTGMRVAGKQLSIFKILDNIMISLYS